MTCRAAITLCFTGAWLLVYAPAHAVEQVTNFNVSMKWSETWDVRQGFVISQGFTTGSTHKYLLNSVTIRTEGYEGSASGRPQLGVWLATHANPNASQKLVKLSGTLEPTTAGSYTYTCSSAAGKCILAASTTYYVALGAVSGGGGSRRYKFSPVTGPSESGSGVGSGWSIANSASRQNTTITNPIRLAVDADMIAVTVSRSDLGLIKAAASESYTAVLSVVPQAAVTVGVAKSSGGDADLSATPSSLTFTTSNWNVAQTVTVSAVADTDNQNKVTTFTHALTGGGGTYNGVTVVSVAAQPYGTRTTTHAKLAAKDVCEGCTSVVERGTNYIRVGWDYPGAGSKPTGADCTDPYLVEFALPLYNRDGHISKRHRISADMCESGTLDYFVGFDWYGDNVKARMGTLAQCSSNSFGGDTKDYCVQLSSIRWGDSTADISTRIARFYSAPVKSLSATAGDEELTITWSPPDSVSSWTFQRYDVKWGIGSSRAASVTHDGSSSYTFVITTGVRNDTQYAVKVSTIAQKSGGWCVTDDGYCPIGLAVVRSTPTAGGGGSGQSEKAAHGRALAQAGRSLMGSAAAAIRSRISGSMNGASPAGAWTASRYQAADGGSATAGYRGFDRMWGDYRIGGILADEQATQTIYRDGVSTFTADEDFRVRMDSRYVYLATELDEVGLYGIVGSGRGHAEVGDQSARLKMHMVTGGSSMPVELADERQSLSLRAEATYSQWETEDGPAALHALDTNVYQLRMGAQYASEAEAWGGVLLLTSAIDLIYDGGGGIAGTGAEVAGTLHYAHASSGATAQAAASWRALPDGHSEWSASVALDAPFANGLSLEMTPSMAAPDAETPAALGGDIRIGYALGAAWGHVLGLHGAQPQFYHATNLSSGRERIGLLVERLKPSEGWTLEAYRAWGGEAGTEAGIAGSYQF